MAPQVECEVLSTEFLGNPEFLEADYLAFGEDSVDLLLQDGVVEEELPLLWFCSNPCAPPTTFVYLVI